MPEINRIFQLPLDENLLKSIEKEMSEEVDRFKKELERLKSKYRKEALQAVEEARNEGYERGMLEQKQIQDAVGKRQALNNSQEGSSKDAHAFAVQLVHDSVEQVYKDLKQGWAESESLSMQQIKASVLASTKKMIANLPDKIPFNTKITSNSSVQNKKNENITVQQKHYTEKDIITPFPLLHSCSMPRQFIGTSVTATSGHVVKGVFLDGQFVSYTVTLEVGDLKKNCYCTALDKLQRISIDTRTSDLKVLFSNLVKEHPWSIVPGVPNKKYKIEAFAKNPHRPKKEEQKHLYRKRMYSLWLQFIANIEALQSAPTLRTFLSLPEVDSIGGLINCVKSSMPQRMHLISLHSTEFCLDKRRRVSTADEVLRKRVNVFIDTDIGAIERSSLNNSDFKDLIYTCNLGPYTAVSEAQGHDDEIKVLINDIQNAAYKDLLTVEKDVSSLFRESTGVIQSCWNIVHTWCELCNSMREFGDSLSEWRSVEPGDSLESVFIGSVSDRCYETNLCMEGVGEVLQCSVTEPSEFILGDCVRTAKERVDTALRTHSLTTFIPDKPYYSLFPHASTDPIIDNTSNYRSAKAHNVGVSELKRVQNSISCSVQVAQGWDNYRKVSKAMLINQFVVAARALAEQHAAAKKVWEAALIDLNNLNVTMSGAEGEERSSGSFYCAPAGGDLTSPALEHITSSLKQAIESELHGNLSHFPAEYHSECYRTSEGERAGSNQSLHRGNTESLHDNYSAYSGDATIKAPSPAPVTLPVQKPYDPSNIGQRNSTVVEKKNAVPSTLSGFGKLLSLKSFRAIFTRAKVPSGKRRNPSIARPVDLGFSKEEEQLATSYNSKIENDESSLRTSDKVNDSDLFQQDQRQHRLAARRQHAGAGVGAGHVTSKIKVNVGVAASAPSPSSDIFGAAPQPAAPIRSFAVPTSTDKSVPTRPTNPPPTPVSASTPIPASSNHPATVPPSPSASTARKMHHTAPAATAAANSTNTYTASAAESASNESENASFPPDYSAKVTLERNASQSMPSVSPGPMPSGWVEVKMEDGGVYFYHTVTRVSRWDRPTAEVAAALEARIQQANAQVDDALQRHKEEREHEKRLQQEKDQLIEKLRSKVKVTVDRWAFGRILGLAPPKIISGSAPSLPAARDLIQLLGSLHEVIPYIPGPAAVVNLSALPQPPNIKTCPPSEIKKAYMRAVRFVHPDKLPDDVALETRLVAEAAFIIITDAFNQYRAATTA